MFGFLVAGKALFVTTLVGLGAVGSTVPAGVWNSLSSSPGNNTSTSSSSSCASGSVGLTPGTTSTTSGTNTSLQLPSATTCSGGTQVNSAYEHCNGFLNASTPSTSSPGVTSTSATQSSPATRPSSHGSLVSGVCSQAGIHNIKGLATAFQGRSHQSTTSTTASTFTSSTTDVPQSSIIQSGPPTQIPAGPGQGAGHALPGHGRH
ncbi:MAG: hypothetical protein ACP5O0_10830 [Acidimicrobiales bacterium]